MNDPRFEALLIAARPAHTTNDHAFTNKVMSAIEKPEIIASQLRKMNVTKKETFIMRLKHLPKFAVVAIALGALLLASGGVYAAYQLLWPKPEIQVSEPETSSSGRQQVVISLAQCGAKGIGSEYELKKNAPISADEIDDVVKARCELTAIGTWAQKTFPYNNVSGRGGPVGESYESSMLNISQATHIKSSEEGSITFTGLTKYNQSDKTFTLAPDVRYIADSMDVSADKISPADPIVYITRETERMTPQPGCDATHCSIASEEVKTELLAVVKLSADFKYYDQLAWQSLAERQACIGNPDDSCLTGYVGGLEVFTSEPAWGEELAVKTIQGIVTELNGSRTTIRSSSGKLFTIVNASDVVSSFNNGRAAQYNWPTVKIGSTLNITYNELKTSSSTTINENQLQSVVLQTEYISKGDAPKAY